MKLEVFRAPTMAEALLRVKVAMGQDALILHTRTICERYCMRLRKREIVEITAARGLQLLPRQRIASAATPPLTARPPVALRQTPYAAVSRAPLGADSRTALIERPEVGNIIVRDLLNEMAAVKSMVQSISTQMREKDPPDLPDEMLDYYQLMLANSVEKCLAAEVARAVHRSIRPEYLRQAEFVKDKLAEQLEKLIPISGPITRTKTRGPHVVALVGPTGVGKTTTIAKLAANLKIKEHRRVGFITIDTYRIAAVDQLKRYATILGAPLRVVPSTDELPAAIQQIGDCEFVLVDTAGRSPNDTLKIGELRSFIRTAAADEVHLVLSMTSSQSNLELAAERFGDVKIDKVIFTKLDEAANTGLLLNLARAMNKAVSYITTGQDVPADIEPANGRRIAQLILGSEL